MAGNIKGITIEFRGDTTKLSAAINKVRGESRTFAKELGYVDKALKFNPGNVDLLKQKIALLSDATQKGEKNIADMKAALQGMKDAGVDETSADYRELEREIIKAENQQKRYNAELKNAKSAASVLGQISTKMKDLGDKATAAGNAMKPFSTAGAAVDAALLAMAVKSGQAADDLNTLSKVTGISTQKLQQYKAASDLVDVSVSTIAKSQTRLKKSMYQAAQGADSLTVAEDGTVESGNALGKAFAKLGVSVTKPNGELKDQEEVFQDTIKALGEMSNETERDAIAQQIFGKSAAELNPLIEDQGKTYKKVADVFEKNDIQLVDQETIDGANAFNDELDTLKASGLATLTSVGMQLSAYLAPALEKVSGFLQSVFTWLSQLSPQTLTVIGIVAGVIAAIAPLLLMFGKISLAISSISGLLSTLGTSFGAIAGPIGIAIAAIAAIIAIGVLLYKNWDKIKAKAAEIKDAVVKKWNELKAKVIGIVQGLKDKVVLLFTAFKVGLQVIVNAVKNFFVNAWTTIKTKVVGFATAIKTGVVNAFTAVKTKVSGILSAIKTTFSNIWSGIKTTVSNVVTGIKDKITAVFTAVKTKVTSIFSGIKTAITTPIEKAKEVIAGIVDKIKTIFGGISFKLPSFKLPHFSITPPGWKIGDLLKGSIPKLGINWYDKGGIFKSPSVIGVGEKRPEFVGALDDLRKIVKEEAGLGNVTVNVYAAPGMDVNKLSDEVVKRLIRETARRKNAWA